MLRILILLASIVTSHALYAEMVGSVIFSEQDSSAQTQPSSPDQVFFNNHVLDIISVTPTKITNPNVDKVFLFPLYMTKVSFDRMSTYLVAAKKDSKLIVIPNPTTEQDMPTLLALINPSFKLSSSKDAAALQSALDIIFPINSHFDQLPATEPKFFKKDNQWIFIRGYFFQDKKGFVFTTNPDGSITSIKYSFNLTNSNTIPKNSGLIPDLSASELSPWASFATNLQTCTPGAFNLPNPIQAELRLTYTIIGWRADNFCQFNMKTAWDDKDGPHAMILNCALSKNDVIIFSNAAKEMSSGKIKISTEDPAAKIISSSCRQAPQ